MAKIDGVEDGSSIGPSSSSAGGSVAVVVVGSSGT